MKSFGLSSFLIFMFTIFILVMRPVIVFSSPAIQSALQTRETKIYGIVKAVRKRQEYYHTPEIINENAADKKLYLLLLPFLFFAIKKWLRYIVSVLSFFLSHCSAFLKRRRTFFELMPGSEHFLALSVLRI